MRAKVSGKPTDGAPRASDSTPRSADVQSSTPSGEAGTGAGEGPSGDGMPDSKMSFVGLGTVENLVVAGDAPVEMTPRDSGQQHKLGEAASTAICGNDITSSCLYVAALCAIAAGPYAFVCLAMVAAMLYLFRNIYAEVGTALPLNGGAYNALLNTTTKFKASVAACLTILSYLATAVISAGEAMHYLHHLWQSLDVIWATVALLGIFAVLNVVGITESAVVAMGIFGIHLATLSTLIVAALIKFGFNFDTLLANLSMPPPGGLGKALVFGFAAGLLGISGFESSANFIEEQKRGVFPKTLRNMWIAVAVLNPLISLLAMCIMPLEESWIGTGADKIPRPDFLAYMGEISAGEWLATAVSIDAVLVLSGAVLTAYVGVTGLVRRMALDRCLPQFLLKENKLRNTNHWIIIGFFALCCSIVAITTNEVMDCEVSIPEPGQGEVFEPAKVRVNATSDGSSPLQPLPVVQGKEACGTGPGWTFDDPDKPAKVILCPASCDHGSADTDVSIDFSFGGPHKRGGKWHLDIGILAGVYTLSFLGVMALFAVGNMLLKVKRRRLPRAARASWPGVTVALLAVLVGLVANALMDYPSLNRLRIFVSYFVVSLGVVALTFMRARIMKVLLAVLRAVIVPINRGLLAKIDEVNNLQTVFFTKGDNRVNLNRAALYVLENEESKWLKVIHVYEKQDDVDEQHLAEQLHTIDELYPELRIDLVLVQGKFGPELIERISRHMGVPKNYMFLGTPGDRFPHNIAELGGVRLII